MVVASSQLVRGMVVPNGGPLQFDVSKVFDSSNEFTTLLSAEENVETIDDGSMLIVSLVNPLRVGRLHLHVSDGETVIDTDVTILPEPAIRLDVSMSTSTASMGIDVSSIFDKFTMLMNPFEVDAGVFDIHDGGLFFSPRAGCDVSRAYAMVYGEKNGVLVVAQVCVTLTPGLAFGR